MTATGCNPDETVLLVDPPVDYGDEDIGVVTGDPELDLGVYEEQLYTPIGEGDELRILFGSQGGTWVMPAVRAQGLNLEVDVAATLTTAEEEVVGETRGTQRLVLATDGWFEIQALPVPVRHEAPNEAEPIDDLYGVEATLRVTLTDPAGTEATASVDIVLGEG